MILRSLKLVNFRGLPQVQVRDLAESGVVRVDLPGDAPESALAEVVRFALMGARAGDEDVVSDGQGYAYVELGFRVPGDSQVSVFRGVDRRGTEQVSLREEGGLRVTGGGDAVSDRLAELLGDDLDGFCKTVLPVAGDVSEAAVLAGTELQDVAPGDAPDAADEPPTAAPIEELRRALRAERLEAEAREHFDDLVEEGRRLRRERADAARSVDRVRAERDRVRTQLRRTNEYRDGLARGEAQERDSAARAPRRGGLAVEWGLATCASVLLLVLVLYSTSVETGGGGEGRMVQVGLGVGFLVAAASYLSVATRRHSGGAGRFVVVPDRDDTRAPPPVDDWRSTLRERFADLDDPDDPEVAASLRARVAELDDEIAPLHARLEELDDAIGVYDVEAGRAARALHVPLPRPEAGERGLPDGAGLGSVLERVKQLGDLVYVADVERDALFANGALPVADARRGAADAISAAGERAGRPDEAAALVSRLAAYDVSSSSDPTSEQAPEDLFAERLTADAAELEENEPAFSRSARFDPAAVTGGALVALDAEGETLRARDSDGVSIAWGDLSDAHRTALGVATALAPAADDSESEVAASTEFVVLEPAPEHLDDAALLRAVQASRPDVRQVVVRGSGPPRGTTPAGQASSRGRQRRPRPRG